MTMRNSSLWWRVPLSLAFIAAISVVCYRLFGVNATTAGLVYLVGILLIAAYWGLAEAVTASIAATIGFSYFFLPPIGHFAISDPENWVALFTFLATALVASHLAERARRQTLEARKRQAETERLYEFSRWILFAGAAQDIGFRAAQELARIFECTSAAMYDPETDQCYYGGQGHIAGIDAKLKEAALHPACGPDSESDALIVGISSGGRALGSLALAGVSLSENALQALLQLVAIALEGARAQAAATRAEAARQSEEFKSTLLDAITHEFKTPLTAIQIASTTIQNDVPDLSPAVRELVSLIDEESSRLNLMVTDAVRMAQMDASHIHLEKRPVAVDEFVGRVVAEFQPRLDGREVHLHIAERLPQITADPDLASMALRQVIDNGLKYSAAATPLEVAADASDGQVTIRVRDQGPGIPQPERERIFERFYRRKMGSGVPGSGMGLHIAREIARAHGGNLWVEAVAGAGSEFCLTLPAAEVAGR